VCDRSYLCASHLEESRATSLLAKRQSAIPTLQLSGLSLRTCRACCALSRCCQPLQGRWLARARGPELPACCKVPHRGATGLQTPRRLRRGAPPLAALMQCDTVHGSSARATLWWSFSIPSQPYAKAPLRVAQHRRHVRRPRRRADGVPRAVGAEPAGGSARKQRGPGGASPPLFSAAIAPASHAAGRLRRAHVRVRWRAARATLSWRARSSMRA